MAAPVTITMKASLTSSSDVPWCAYYNKATGEWESDGLVIESVSAQVSGATESDGLNVDLSCVYYHLSDFTVSTTEADGIFNPVELVMIFYLPFKAVVRQHLVKNLATAVLCL